MAKRRNTDGDNSTMHFEDTSRRDSEGREMSLCGLSFPTAGFHTDDENEFEMREGSRCKRCWRTYAARGMGASAEMSR